MPESPVTDHPEGCLLAVKAHPGARRDAIAGEQAGALRVSVQAPADQGKANRSLVAFLAKTLKVKRSQLELVRGARSRDKVFLVRGLPAAELKRRLHECLLP
jgi:uncharacterized protein (TIGR00251 family)